MRQQTIQLADTPLLVFGGNYSNLQATQAIKAEAERLGIPPSQVLCHGDCVAYCAQPNETVALMRDWGVHCIRGNCEQALALQADDCGCGFDEGSQCSLLSRQWYAYSQQQLWPEHRQWMAHLYDSMRFEYCGKSLLLVHATPNSNNRFVYRSTVQALWTEIRPDSSVDVVLAGHCGLPFFYREDGQYWLNSGVIGMPANDASADGWYLLLEPYRRGFKARWQRLPYEAESAQQQMLQSGLNNAYAEALTSGLWPSLDTLPKVEAAQQGKHLLMQTLPIA